MQLIPHLSNLSLELSVLFLRLELAVFQGLEKLGVLGPLGLLEIGELLGQGGMGLGGLLGEVFELGVYPAFNSGHLLPGLSYQSLVLLVDPVFKCVYLLYDVCVDALLVFLSRQNALLHGPALGAHAEGIFYDFSYRHF